MNVYTVTPPIGICCGLYFYFKKKLNYFEELGIPYLPGWPVFGNLAPTIFYRKHFTELVENIYYVNPDAKYVGMFDLFTPTILIRDPELIKSVTIKNFNNFCDHANLIDPKVDPVGGSMLYYQLGDEWKEAKDLLCPALASNKMKCMSEKMVTCVQNYIDFLSKQKTEDNKMINTKNFFTKLTNDIIVSSIFGIEIDSLNDPKNDFYKHGLKATSLEGPVAFKIFLARALPGLMSFLNIKFVDDKAAKYFQNVVKSIIDSREKEGIRKPDMIQSMIDARTEKCKRSEMNIVEMTAQAFSLFFGGFETTSTQMCIIAHELAINPNVQEKLQKEIDQVFNLIINGKSYYEAINDNMPYFDAVFNESMRLHTQPIVIDRMCTKDFEMPPALPDAKPYLVKKGTYVLIPAYSIHRDAKHYENPHKFDPDRYLNKKIDTNDSLNLGFGIGPRACSGNQFAILETKILFLFLLSKFSLRPNEKTMAPLRYSKKNFSILADGGFWLSIVPRNN